MPISFDYATAWRREEGRRMETEGRARENWRERERFEMLNEKRKMTASAQKLEKKKKK